jgi:AbrB family looped-hinge helix DNA binding protein
MPQQDNAVEYLTTARIGEKGQLTVPKQFREDLGLETGSPFAVLRLGDGLILLPEQQRFDSLCQQVSSALISAALTPEDVVRTLPEARERIFQRRYGIGKSSPVAASRRRSSNSHSK